MKKSGDLRLGRQDKVNAYFQAKSSFWKNIYSSNGVYAEIHRDRHATALYWIDSLALAPGSKVLEVGCGAGFMAVALAERGLHVHAVDSIKDMVDQARLHAVESGTAELLSVDVGDVYDLPFKDESFDLVIALGVIPWLAGPELAIREIARATRPGGHVILTSDNRKRLNNLLDPWLNPALSPLKRQVKAALEWAGLHRQSLKDMGANSHDCHFIDSALEQVDLVKVRSKTLGFGPFSLFRYKIIPESLSIMVHHRLQHLADRNLPGFRSTGAHYLILARKSASQAFVFSASAEGLVSGAAEVLSSEMEIRL